MTKKILAVLDPDEAYVTRFMEYGNRMSDLPFTIRAFTNPDALMKFLASHSVEVLLLSDLIHLTDTPQVRLTVRLSESRPAQNLQKPALREENAAPKVPDPPVIFKYQASSLVLKKLVEVYENETGIRVETAESPVSEILGIFSPLGRCGKTTFALTLGECLAMKKPTLLINLEPCSGWKELFHDVWDRDISEGICAIRSGESPSAASLADVIRKIGDLSYLPPFTYAPDLFSVTMEEWSVLFRDIAMQMAYEAIVIDFDSIPWIHPGVLSLCRHVYMPVLKDPTSGAKLKEMNARFSALSKEENLPAATPVSVLDQTIPDFSERRAELLPYSGLGAYVRKIIARDKL
ncbi:MAG: hypothetical protein VZR02_02375 [Lachnospiraceae bacterium]|nr:hypothetical protein [Lachnospiraceae bacterium]